MRCTGNTGSWTSWKRWCKMQWKSRYEVYRQYWLLHKLRQMAQNAVEELLWGVQAILTPEQVERDGAKCSGKVIWGVESILALSQVETDGTKCSGKVIWGVEAILAP
jgi:hypothetical protein